MLGGKEVQQDTFKSSPSDDHVHFEGADLTIPEYAFHPDNWTKTLLTGLEELDLYGKSLFEVGVGSGAVPACLLKKHPEIKHIYGSDITQELLVLAKENLKNNEQLYRFTTLNRAYSLLDGFESDAAVRGTPDIIYACIPQVGLPHEEAIANSDNYAHYYTTCDIESKFNSHFLGLNDLLLEQAAKILPAGNQIVLNLAGRAPVEVITELFRYHDFTPQIIHTELVAQCSSTSLGCFVRAEKESGQKFEFYKSNDDILHLEDERISATDAEKRRQAGKEVFHTLHVVCGTKNG